MFARRDCCDDRRAIGNDRGTASGVVVFRHLSLGEFQLRNLYDCRRDILWSNDDLDRHLAGSSNYSHAI